MLFLNLVTYFALIYEWTAWHVACMSGKTETVQLIIQYSKDFDIDLNAKDNDGRTALHVACKYGRTEFVQMIVKNWKEYEIDIRAQDTQGNTALEFMNHQWMDGEVYDQIKPILEKEYASI